MQDSAESQVLSSCSGTATSLALPKEQEQGRQVPLGIFLRVDTAIMNTSGRHDCRGHYGHRLEPTSAPDGRHCGKACNRRNVNKDKVNIHLVNPAANCVQSVLKDNTVGIRAVRGPIKILIFGLFVIHTSILGEQVLLRVLASSPEPR